MARTIILTKVRVKSVEIDVETKVVTVHYVCANDDGTVLQNGTAFFTRPLPEGAGRDFFLVPLVRAQEIVSMVTDIKAALENRFLADPVP